MTEHSRLHLYAADTKEGGPQTALVIKGFSGPAEIQEFVDKALAAGLFRPPAETVRQ